MVFQSASRGDENAPDRDPRATAPAFPATARAAESALDPPPNRPDTAPPPVGGLVPAPSVQERLAPHFDRTPQPWANPVGLDATRDTAPELGPHQGEARLQHVGLRQDPAFAPAPHRLPEQIVHAARGLTAGPVEITLSPEELGRVRMQLQVSEQGVTVVIVAERVETLELMRRHGDLLSRDFNRLGHENVSLSFGDPGNPRHSPRGGQRAQDEPQDVPVQTDTVGQAQPAASGMDMRL